MKRSNSYFIFYLYFILLISVLCISCNNNESKISKSSDSNEYFYHAQIFSPKLNQYDPEASYITEDGYDRIHYWSAYDGTTLYMPYASNISHDRCTNPGFYLIQPQNEMTMALFPREKTSGEPYYYQEFHIGSFFNAFDINASGSYAIVQGTLIPKEEFSNDNYNYLAVSVWSSDGTLQYEKYLKDNITAQIRTGSYVHGLECIIDNNGYVCIHTSNYLKYEYFCFLDPEGNITKEVFLDAKELTLALYTAKLQKTTNGAVYLIYSDKISNEIQYSSVDFSTQTFSEPMILSCSQGDINGIWTLNENGIFYSSNGASFSRYPADGSPHKLFDWSEHGIIGKYIDAIYLQDEKNIIVLTHNPINDQPEIVYIDYVPADTIPEKTDIYIACGLYRDKSIEYLQTAVNLFNRTSDQYRVTVEYYEPENKGLYSVNQQIATDMMNGKQIDLILFHKDITMEYFDRLGILGDFYALMDNDSKYTRDAFLPCIRSAYETTDGTLPVLTTDFGITTLVGTAENLGGLEHWNYDECAAFIDTLEQDQCFIKLDKEKNDTRKNELLVLQSFLPMVLDDYIDEDSATCSFDSESFLQLIKLCERVPINHERSKFQDEQGVVEYIYESMSFINEYRRGKTVLFNQRTNQNNGAWTITHPMDLMILLEQYFIGQRPVTFIGYPLPESADDNGSAVTPYVQFGLTASAQHLDGIWEFVKGYLDYQTERKQNNNIVQYLPCTYSAYNKLIDFYETREFLMAGGPHIQEYEPSGFAERNSYYHTANLEVRDCLLPLLEQTTRRYSGSDTILDIIYEEVPYYFDGIRSVEEAAKLIQSRVSLFLSETH